MLMPPQSLPRAGVPTAMQPFMVTLTMVDGTNENHTVKSGFLTFADPFCWAQQCDPNNPGVCVEAGRVKCRRGSVALACHQKMPVIQISGAHFQDVSHKQLDAFLWRAAPAADSLLRSVSRSS